MPQEPDNAILQEILEEAAALAAQAVGLICRIGDRQFIPPPGQFGEFWYKTGKTLVSYPGMTTGDSARTVGILQFTIYAPEQWGKGYSLPLAEELIEKFKNATFSQNGHTVLLERLKAVEMQAPYRGRRITIVDAGFDYFEPERATSYSKSANS